MSGENKPVSVFLTCIRHGETLYNRSRTIQGQLDVPLSSLGQSQARRLGRFIHDNQHCKGAVGFVSRPHLMLTSPLLRAYETATLVQQGAQWDLPLESSPVVKEICFGAGEGCAYYAVTARLMADPQIQSLLGIDSVAEFDRNAEENWGTIARFWREHPEHATEMVAPLDRLQPPSSLVMETPDDMRQRAQALIQRIGEAIKEAQAEGSLSAELGSVKAPVHVVVVSHGFYLRVLISYILFGCGGEEEVREQSTIPFHLLNTSVSMLRFQLHKGTEAEASYQALEPQMVALNAIPHLYQPDPDPPQE